MISRQLAPRVRESFRRSPIVTVTGPRQSGKTTLCRAVFPDLPYATLEAPDVRTRALDDPRGFLSDLSSPAIIDEVQRVPELLSYIQVLSDERREPGQYVLTGSNNFTLLKTLSQSLAGRTAIFHLLPMELAELRGFANAPKTLEETLFAGAYPRIFDQGVAPEEWYADYVTTYVERDLRQVLNVGDLQVFRTFLGLCAGRSGQLLNLTSLGNDCGIDAKTVKSWIGALETGFLVFRLPPFHRNLRKRLVRSPKLYFHDTGLLCHLLGIHEAQQLRTHPLRGAIFETWAIAEIVRMRLHRGVRGNAFFYRDQSGRGIDLVLPAVNKLTAIEMKSGQTVTSGFFGALREFEDVMARASQPEAIEKVLVYGGEGRHAHLGAEVVPWSEVPGYSWVD